jgi:hypothetical protein
MSSIQWKTNDVFHSKLQNVLDLHLYFIMGMYSQKFYILQKFPYDVTYAHWAIVRKYGRYGLNSWAFLVVMHVMKDLAYGASQTWAKILFWGFSTY